MLQHAHQAAQGKSAMVNNIPVHARTGVHSQGSSSTQRFRTSIKYLCRLRARSLWPRPSCSAQRAHVDCELLAVHSTRVPIVRHLGSLHAEAVLGSLKGYVCVCSR